MYLYLFLHRVSPSFCSPTTTTVIASWSLLFELICSYIGIVFFNKCIIYIRTLFSIYLLNRIRINCILRKTILKFVKIVRLYMYFEIVYFNRKHQKKVYAETIYIYIYI